MKTGVQVIVDATPDDWSAIHGGSSVRSTRSLAAFSHFRDKTVDIITTDYRLHKSLLENSGSQKDAMSPSCYVRFRSGPMLSSPNSSDSLTALADSYYQRAAHQLSSLRGATDDFGDNVMEDAAIDTAEAILGNLKRANYSPPELSWHGGDAVVMLWSAEDTTYAITVTDGEWGYVARRAGKQIRMDDSLKVERFLLEHHP